jgi:putative aldouronate transport system permease protein
VINQSRSDRIVEWTIVCLLGLVLVIVMYPLIYVFSASLSDPLAILKGEVRLLPKGFNLDAYKKVFQNQNIIRGYLNTFIYTLTGTAINVVMTTLAAYPLSRKDFYGRNVFNVLIVFTMFFSGGMVPMYILVSNLNLLNTIWAVVLPGAISVWNMMIMRTYFQSNISLEIQEAAAMDGCSNIGILSRIVLPLSAPILAVMILFYAVGHWNAFYNALMYLSDRSKFPLQVILREILIQNRMDEMASVLDEDKIQYMMNVEALKYAVVIVANIPVFILYPFLQKYFVKGVMIGALKG